MTLRKQLFACLAAAFVVSALAALAAFHAGHRSSFSAAAHSPAMRAETPAIAAMQETARQQRQAAEQLAAWQQDLMGGVVWEE